MWIFLSEFNFPIIKLQKTKAFYYWYILLSISDISESCCLITVFYIYYIMSIQILILKRYSAIILYTTLLYIAQFIFVYFIFWDYCFHILFFLFQKNEKSIWRRIWNRLYFDIHLHYNKTSKDDNFLLLVHAALDFRDF